MAANAGERGLLELLLSQPRKLAQKELAATIRAAASDEPILALWWDDLPNWGDIVNPVLIEHLSGRPALQLRRVLNVRRRTVYSVIGSVLDGLAHSPVEVWGSGFKFESSGFRVRPRRIHAMRGPLSAAVARRQGLSVPEVYGDPALLFPMIHRPPRTDEYELGLVPHYADRDSPWISRLREQPGVLVIDVLAGVMEVPDQMARCSTVASSSLHGMILADAYGIPSTWIELSSRVEGKGFKFRDYLAGVGRRERAPLHVGADTTVQQILDRMGNDPARPDLEALLGSCPFASTEWASARVPESAGSLASRAASPAAGAP